MNPFRKSVSDIIADITGKVDQLHAAADAHLADAVRHEDVAAKRQAIAADARQEAARAIGVAAKLKALVTP